MVLKNKKNPDEKCAMGSLQEAALTHVRANTRSRKGGPWEKKLELWQELGCHQIIPLSWRLSVAGLANSSLACTPGFP